MIAAAALGLAGVPDARADEHAAIVKERTLSAERVTAEVGDTLVVRNEDEIVHSLVSMTPGHEFGFGEQMPGQMRTLDLDTPGEMTVRRHIHPLIRMTVIVFEQRSGSGP